MDRLEQFILRNKEEFDVYTPSLKVEKNIKFRKSKNLYIVQKIMKNAAVFLLIFGASYFFHSKFPLDSLFNSDSRIEMEYPELYEAKQFYTKQVDYKMQEVSKHLENYPEIKEELNYEFNELDSVYKSLKDDLKEDIANEEVVNAMIQNYKLKLQILEEILKKLQRIENKEEKNKKHNSYLL
jgi:hypothetical protein